MAKKELKLNKYKFRAECSVDAEQFIHLNGEAVFSFEIEPHPRFPDVTVTIESPLKLSEIIDAMRNIEDAHVMYQTVKPIEQYTGIRDYEL